MTTYGGELAHWYLRLNGFFIIDDFVIYREIGQSVSEEATHVPKSSVDADLLAIRLPYTAEKVRDANVEMDDLLKMIGLVDKKNNPIDHSIIGAICEVKTGRLEKEHFKEEHLARALGRLGFIPHQYVGHITPILKDQRGITSDDKDVRKIYESAFDFKILKILFTTVNADPEDCFAIKLETVNNFIINRLVKYRELKFGDRTYFPSPLIQYLNWRVTRPKRFS